MPADAPPFTWLKRSLVDRECRSSSDRSRRDFHNPSLAHTSRISGWDCRRSCWLRHSPGTNRIQCRCTLRQSARRVCEPLMTCLRSSETTNSGRFWDQHSFYPLGGTLPSAYRWLLAFWLPMLSGRSCHLWLSRVPRP
jgi:hypothetical protein